MDKLQSCAASFARLLHTRYEITLARKGKTAFIQLCFQPADFFHVAGLHKLTDIAQIRDRKHLYVFQDILDGTITEADAMASCRYSEIGTRIAALTHLEQMLDGDDLYFAYDENAHPYSRINAKFLVSGTIDDAIAFLFLDNGDNGIYFPRSFFPMERTDYRRGLRKFTLLEKSKVNTSTGQRTLQFRYASNSSYSKEKALKTLISAFSRLFAWRRRRDLNPRALFTRLLP